MDIRLYNKARAIIEPFAFEKYRKEKIHKQIEAAGPNRVQLKSNLPKVNQEMALKLMDDKTSTRKKKNGTTNLLDDNRFKAMFEKPEFEIDKNAMEYKMLTPVLSRLDASKAKKLKRQAQKAQFEELQADEDVKSSDDDLFSEKEDSDDEGVDDGSSDDDDRELAKDMKKQYKQLRKEKLMAEREEAEEEDADDAPTADPKMIALETNDFKVKSLRKKTDK